jgi:WD40 repeat protein
VACYSAADGTRIWQRKDLKKAQRLTPSRDGNSIFCGFSEGPCELLDVRTGETIAKIRATRNVVESRYQPISFVDRLRPELTEVTGNRIAFIPRETFAVLTVAFSPTSVCISECGGPVRCLETSRGNEIWRYTPLPGKHVLSLEYSSSADCFYGVEWPYAQGGVKELLRFKSESGQDSKVTLIGGPAETTFCMAGKRLLTSLGQLIELETGETVRQIPF